MSLSDLPRWRLVVSALLLSPLAAFAEESATRPLRIVTFNAEILTAPRVYAGKLQRFRTDRGRNGHLERVADLIETLTPDVLNLVEVTSQEAVDRLVELLHEKGLKDYRGYHVESHDEFSGLDVAVLSRLPLDTVDGATIRTLWSDEEDPTWRQSFKFVNWEGEPSSATVSVQRNAYYFLSFNGWKLGFFGLHLKSNPSSDYANARRTAETAVARRAIRAEIAARGYLPLVLGDLNDYDPEVPDPDETRSTKTTVLADLKDYDPERPGPELVNAAKWIARSADRYSSIWDYNENRAPDGDDVYTLIDHVLLPKELAPHVRRVFICHAVALATSDHFPVVVDLALPRRGKE